MMQLQRKQKPGFTIIELLIASILFVLLAVSAITVFMFILRIQERVNAQKKLQEESRYLIEKIVKEVRNSTIDYAYYYNQNYPGLTYEDYAALPPDGTVTGYVGDFTSLGDVSDLALLDVSGSLHTIFEQTATDPMCDPDFETCEYNLTITKQGYFQNGADFSWANVSWQYADGEFILAEAVDPDIAVDILNSDRTNISQLRFLITPTKDPFKFYDDNSVQEQPMITIYLTTEYLDDTLSTTPVELQTSVSIRTYQHIPWTVLE